MPGGRSRLTVAILAVSKTGAAYVALDPDYPHERLMHALLSWSGDQERTATIMRRALPPVVGFLTPESDCYNETLAPRDPARCAPGALPLADLIGVTDAAKGAEHADQGIISSTGRPRGSNAWAVGAAKTRDGRAILANDMHLELSVPNIWYRAELRYPGATLSGLTLPGFPLLIAGTNGHLAWRLTSIEGDFVDLVTIEEDSRDRNQYRTPAGLLPFETRSEAIHVRGGADETLRVRTTIWGPVLPKTLLGRLVAAHWTALDPVSTDLSLVDLARITSVTSAIALFNRAGGPPLNVLLADRSGKIAWTYMGGILHMPGGQSGQTGSRHFSDQQESRVEGQPSRFSSDAFVHRLTLKPPPSGL
jgi:penicillin G amidase